MAVWGDADQASGRLLGTRVGRRVRGLEDVNAIAPIDCYAEHLAQARCHDPDVSAPCNPVHALRIERSGSELTQIAHVENTAVRHHRRDDMSLRSRNIYYT